MWALHDRALAGWREAQGDATGRQHIAAVHFANRRDEEARLRRVPARQGCQGPRQLAHMLPGGIACLRQMTCLLGDAPRHTLHFAVSGATSRIIKPNGQRKSV